MAQIVKLAGTTLAAFFLFVGVAHGAIAPGETETLSCGPATGYGNYPVLTRGNGKRLSTQVGGIYGGTLFYSGAKRSAVVTAEETPEATILTVRNTSERGAINVRSRC